MDESFTVKVTDSALSPDLFPEDYPAVNVYSRDYRSHEPIPRPIKWMAIESLVEQKFTQATDTVKEVGQCVCVRARACVWG